MENKQIVLTVEDEALMSMALTLVLESKYDIHPVKSAECMFKVLENGLMPNIILMDIALDGMDGIKAIELLKNDIRYKDIPIIVVSSYDTKENRFKAFNAGAIDFIAKPIESTLLKFLIKVHIKEVGNEACNNRC